MKDAMLCKYIHSCNCLWSIHINPVSVAHIKNSFQQESRLSMFLKD